jgi:hypothetical protein
MKRFWVLVVAITGIVCATTASADYWVYGTITDIQIIATGGAGDKVAVYGNFSPSMGCTYNGFFLLASDSYFSQSYAALLLAKATGATVRFTFSYCDSASGFGRGNSYTVLAN